MGIGIACERLFPGFLHITDRHAAGILFRRLLNIWHTGTAPCDSNRYASFKVKLSVVVKEQISLSDIEGWIIAEANSSKIRFALGEPNVKSSLCRSKCVWDSERSEETSRRRCWPDYALIEYPQKTMVSHRPDINPRYQ